jgi:catechol 2,3-dioxygenase
VVTTSKVRKMVGSNVRHFRLTTMNLPEMVGWYARLFGLAAAHSSSTTGGSQSASGLTAAWSSNDASDPRVTIVSLSATSAATQPSDRGRVQSVTFECATLDELLAAYVRVKGLGLEPFLAVDQGPSTVFYYEDPDHNLVELRFGSLGRWPQSCDNTPTSPKSRAQLPGTRIDPEKMIAARARGMSIAEIHRSACVGEVASWLPVNPSYEQLNPVLAE